MRRLVLTLVICCGWALPAVATTVVPLSFEQLVNESSSVVYGRVTEVRSQWTDDRRFIESIVSIEILKGMKGGARNTVSITVPGGQVGRYLNVIPGAPVFTTGDLAVFFLTAHGPRLPVTTGLTQGVYRVQRDARSGEMLVLPPAIDAAVRIARGDVKRKPVSLASFEGSVRAIVALRLAQGHPERSRGVDPAR
jgi:hypothetical protein